MTSDPDGAFVWIWLPGHVAPVVAGRVERRPGGHVFFYGRSYLSRHDAVAIYLPELPLDDNEHRPLDGPMPLCLDDAAPDAWGRSVVNGVLGQPGAELSPLTYLLESGSNRVGAIDFQRSATDFVPRAPQPAPLEQLMRAAEVIHAGEPIDPHLAALLVHGTPLGGARPKAAIVEDGVEMLAKFSKLTDTFPWVQAEFVAMRLAELVGLDVARVHYAEVVGRSVILVDRFDRPIEGGRRRVVSAATILGMQPMVAARNFTYCEFADEIRARFIKPEATLRELYARIMFNVLVGNTDDHARNHAAFPLAGHLLALTPAYDIAPQPRSGDTARHPRFNDGASGRDSRVDALIDAAPIYHLTRADGREIADGQVSTIGEHWDEVCDQARLTAAQRGNLRHDGPFLHRSVFYR